MCPLPNNASPDIKIQHLRYQGSQQCMKYRQYNATNLGTFFPNPKQKVPTTDTMGKDLVTRCYKFINAYRATHKL